MTDEPCSCEQEPDMSMSDLNPRTDPIEHIGQTVDVQYYSDHHSLSIVSGARLDTVNHLGVGITVGYSSGQFFPWTSIVRLILT